MQKLTYFVSIIVLFSLNVVAQEQQSDRNSVLKFTPTRLFRGEILFSYERMIAEQASLQISFGPAISNVSPFDLDHLINSQSYNATQNSLLGYTLSLAARYYPLEDKDAMEGFYISPVIGINQLNYTYSFYTYNPNPNPEPYPGSPVKALDDQRGYSKNTSFAFVFGTQRWLSNSFSLDLYLGSGLKLNNTKSFYTNYYYDPNTNQENFWWTEQNYSDVSWFLTMGVRVGIGFGHRK